MAKERKGKELPEGKPKGRGKRSSSTRSQRNIAHGHACSPGIQPADCEERYRALFDRSLQYVVITDFEGNILDANEMVLKLLGYDREDILHLNIASLLSEDQLLKASAALQELKNTGTTGQLNEWRLRLKDGSFVDVLLSGTPIYHEGKPHAILGIGIDITERKRAEEALNLQAQILHNIAEGVVITRTKDAVIVYTNPKFEDMFGYGPGDLIGKNISVVNAPTDKSPEELARDIQRDLKETGVWRGEICNIKKDGTFFWCHANVSTFNHPEHGNVWVDAHTDITERKRDEEALRLSERNFRDSIEKSPLGIRIVTGDGKTLYVNKTLLDICGYGSLKELKAMPRNQLYTPESYAEHRERVNKRKRREHVPSKYEISIVRKDGQVRWLSVSRREVLWNGEKQFQVVYQDITESKRAQQVLEKSEEKYRSMFEEALDAIFIGDAETGVLIDCNRAACELVGRERSELIGKHQRILHPTEETAGGFTRTFREHLQAKEGKLVETQVITKKGEIKDVAIKANLLGFEGKKVLQGIFRDMTQRKQAEEALRKSEERYRQLAENAGEAIFVVQDGMIKFMNPKGEELSGYSIEEMASKPFVKFIHPDDVALVADRYARRLKGKPTPQIYDFRIVRKDGDIRWGELNAVPISWEDQPAVLCFMNDITERKKTEEALRQSEERYRTILEEMEDSYFEVDLGGHITFINSAGCRHLGYSMEELIGKRMSYKDYTAEDYIKSIFQTFNEVYRTGVPNKGFNWKIIRKDGSVAFTDTSVSPLRNAKGEIIGFSGVGRDVTERRKIEEQLIVTDRLASIGQLAAGIAHELNNPLTGVIGFSDLLLERDLPADVKEDLETVNQEAKRAVNIVKALLTFAREQKTEKSLVNINIIIQGVLQIRSYEQKVSNIEVDARFAPALPLVMANGVQLQQVFINIIVNAEQAMTEAHGRGKLAIITEQVGDMVRASITDDGPGISPANMKLLFTPFFTTREVGKGTGLGLSICHGIVTEHGGKLHVESEPGKGATFVVELPIRK